MDLALQRKLRLPLPDACDEAERDEAARLLHSAIERLRHDRSDTGGLDAVRDFAAGCHERHGKSDQ